MASASVLPVRVASPVLDACVDDVELKEGDMLEDVPRPLNSPCTMRSRVIRADAETWNGSTIGPRHVLGGGHPRIGKLYSASVLINAK